MELSSRRMTGKRNVIAMFGHMGVITMSLAPFLNLLLPFFLWFQFRGTDEFITKHAIEALNFNILYTTIYTAVILITVDRHATLPRLIELFMFITATVGMFRCGRGLPYRYPFTIRLFR